LRLGRRFLFLRRTIGLALILILFLAPLIAEGTKGVNFIIALLVNFPMPLITVPYLAMALYLLLSKKPRKIDIVLIIVCVMLLLSLLVTAMYVMLIFFLPFLILSTPVGPFLILTLIVVLVATLRRRRKWKTEAQKPTFAPAPLACPHCGRDLSTLPKDITICPYCGEAASSQESLSTS